MLFCLFLGIFFTLFLESGLYYIYHALTKKSSCEQVIDLKLLQNTSSFKEVTSELAAIHRGARVPCIVSHMFNSKERCHGNHLDYQNAWVTSGRPILHAEGQFIVSNLSPSQFVPMRTIPTRNLKEILRRALTGSNGEKTVEVKKKDTVLRTDEFEMTSMKNVSNGEESGIEKSPKDKVDGKNPQELLKHFSELLRWISEEGNDYVCVETVPDLNTVFNLFKVISRSRQPVLTTLLISDAEPNLVSVCLSSVVVDLQCLLFCMFQSSLNEE